MVKWSGVWTLLATLLIVVDYSVCAEDKWRDGALRSLQLISSDENPLPPYYPDVSQSNENWLGPDSAKCPAYAFETVFGRSSPFGKRFIRSGGRYSEYSKATELYSDIPLPKKEWNSVYQENAENPLCKKFVNYFANLINNFKRTVSRTLDELKKKNEQQKQQGTEPTDFVYTQNRKKKTKGGKYFVYAPRSRRNVQREISKRRHARRVPRLPIRYLSRRERCKMLGASDFSDRYFKDTLLNLSKRLVKHAPMMAETGRRKCVFAAVQQLTPICFFNRVTTVIHGKYCSKK